MVTTGQFTEEKVKQLENNGSTNAPEELQNSNTSYHADVTQAVTEIPTSAQRFCQVWPN